MGVFKGFIVVFIIVVVLVFVTHLSPTSLWVLSENHYLSLSSDF